MPKDVHLDSMAWDAESGIVTPTFKLKRHDARLHYAAQVRRQSCSTRPRQAAWRCGLLV